MWIAEATFVLLAQGIQSLSKRGIQNISMRCLYGRGSGASSDSRDTGPKKQARFKDIKKEIKK
jgi:hypothetical protein